MDSQDKLICDSFDLVKYLSPMWKGNIIYNESVFPVENSDGSVTYDLLYTPDKVLRVCDTTLKIIYEEGRDYIVSGKQITFLYDGKIDIKPYTFLHPTLDAIPENYTDWIPYYPHVALGDGLYDFHSEKMSQYQINVTYLHSDKWEGPVPECKINKLPNTKNKIKNTDPMNIVYYGDSICDGLISSTYIKSEPFAPAWNRQITSYLSSKCGIPVSAYYSAVGGSDAVGMSLPEKVEKFVISHDPDLVFIEFGTNDAQNYFVDKNSTMEEMKEAYKKGVLSIISQIRNRNPECEFILVSPFFSNPFDFGMSYFEACADVLKEVEASIDGIALADINEMHKYLLTKKKHIDFCGDNLCHPNDYMSRFYSAICLETILENGINPIIV